MKIGSPISAVHHIKNRFFQKLGLFSSLRFWFAVILTAYVLLVATEYLELRVTQNEWWDDFYTVTSPFLIGGLISFLFYFLVVHVPERKKSKIIKSNLKSVYAGIKKDILYQVIFASQKGGRRDLQADSETISRLLTIGGFKEAFEGGREADEGFYAFENHISEDTPEFRNIILNLQILSKQIDYVLHNYSILDEEVFGFFKRLEVYLMRIQNLDANYDDAKTLSAFIWEIFTGWSIVSGYGDHDIIEKMISDI